MRRTIGIVGECEAALRQWQKLDIACGGRDSIEVPLGEPENGDHLPRATEWMRALH